MNVETLPIEEVASKFWKAFNAQQRPRAKFYGICLIGRLGGDTDGAKRLSADDIAAKIRHARCAEDLGGWRCVYFAGHRGAHWSGGGAWAGTETAPFPTERKEEP